MTEKPRYNSLDEMLERTISLYASDVGFDVFQKTKDRDVFEAKAALVNAIGGFMPSMSRIAPFFRMSRTNMLRIRDNHSRYMDSSYYRYMLMRANRVAHYTGIGTAPTSEKVKRDILKIKNNSHEDLQATA